MENKDSPPGRNKPALNPASAPAPKASPPPPPTKPIPPPAVSAPSPEPLPKAVASALKPAAADAPLPSDFLGKAASFYQMLFPLGSPQRRYGPVIVAAALLFLLLLGKCAISSALRKSPEELKAAQAKVEAETTGRLVIKSNRPNTTVEVAKVPAAADAVALKGAEEGAAEQTLSRLPPGKYTVTARSEGWPELRAETTVTAGQATEVAIHFPGGSLKLDSTPTGATVKQGKAVLGKTPLLIALLPPGENSLSLEYSSWPAVPYQAAITENQESAAAVRLPHGKLTVNSVPAGAIVVLDGKAYQKTPLFFDPVAAGPQKLTLQMKDFPSMDVSVTVVDGEEVKIRPVLATAFPVLDPAELLRAVWLPDDSRVPRATTGIYRPKNDVVKNLRREWLYSGWLRKIFRYSGPVKSYDDASGRLEFAEQKSELARYRVVAQVKSGTPSSLPVAPKKDSKDKEPPVVLAVYGRLTGVEEPAWPARVITLELSDAEFLPEGTP